MARALSDEEKQYRADLREEQRAHDKIKRAAERLVEVVAENRWFVSGPSGDLLEDTCYYVQEAHDAKYGPPPPRPPRTDKRPKPPSSAKTLELLGIACAQCGSKDRVALDHIVPVIAGGTYAAGNVQPLCRSCNSSKGGRR